MKLSSLNLNSEWVLLKPLKEKTWVQIQYDPVNVTTEELQEKSLDEVEKEEQEVEEVRTEIICNFQQAKIIAIGSGQTSLGLKEGDIVIFKYGSGEDFQLIKDTKIMQKHQIIGKVF